MWACSIGVLGPRLPNVQQSPHRNFQTVEVGRANSIPANRLQLTSNPCTYRAGGACGVHTHEQFVERLPMAAVQPSSSEAICSAERNRPLRVIRGGHLSAAWTYQSAMSVSRSACGSPSKVSQNCGMAASLAGPIPLIAKSGLSSAARNPATVRIPISDSADCDD